MTVIAAADGSALGNPGPAGWAWYIDDARWASGGWPHGTNNMGELTAVLDLLQQTASLDEELLVLCDSVYAINTITKWMAGWKRKGWRKGDGKAVANLDIVKALDEAMTDRNVRFQWVKGHAGHDLNEKADRLANAAARAFQSGTAHDAGPGFLTTPAAVPAPRTPVDDGTLGQGETLFDLDEADASSAREQVIAGERALLSAEVRSDPASAAALLHPDWTEIGASGRLWTRDDLLAHLAPLPEPVTLEILHCDPVSEDHVLLVWRSVSADGTALRSSLWVRTPGGWRQRFHQGTRET